MDLNDEPLLTRLRASLVIVLVTAWLAFALITWIVVGHPSGTSLDLWLAPKLFEPVLSSPVLTDLGRLLDIIGGDLVAGLVVLITFIVLLRAKRPLLAGYLAASAIGGVLLCTLVKAGVDRSRPPTVGALLQEGTLSYPSGHATSGISVIVALGIVCLVALRPGLRWWFAAPLFVLGPLVGVSRVAMGVHWPTDVLGGWALGTAWTATVAFVVVGMALSGSRRSS